MALKIRPLAERPPMEPTTIQFVTDGEPHGYPWSSGVGGIAWLRVGHDRAMSWGEVIDQHFEWANDPDLDDTVPDGWVRLIPEEEK